MNIENLLKFLCPQCGSPLGGFGPEDICMGVRCTSCDYVGAVTTNHNHPAFDQTPYSIWVELESAGQQRLRELAAVAVILGIGVVAARDLIDTGKPVCVDVRSSEVQRLYRLFQQRGLKFRISPEFRWKLDANSA